MLEGSNKISGHHFIIDLMMGPRFDFARAQDHDMLTLLSDDLWLKDMGALS